MTKRNVSAIDQDSEPGVYEILTLNGTTYEIRLETETNGDLLVISEDAGKPEDLLGRETLHLISFELEVGKPGVMVIDDLEDDKGQRRVKTAEVAAIVKIG